MKDFMNILRRFIPPYKSRLILNFLYNILSALFTVFSVMMMIPILDIIFETSKEVKTLVDWSLNLDAIKNNAYYYVTYVKNVYGPGATLLIVGVFVIFATMLKVAFAYMAAYEAVYIRNGVVKDIRQQIYYKILRLAMRFFSDERKGDIMARITGDVTEVENSIMSSLDMFLKNPIMILVLLISLLVMSPTMTLFIFLLLPIAGFIIGRVGRSLKKVSREGQDQMGVLLTIIEESLSGLRIIKAFNAEKKMDARFNDELYQYRSIMNRLMRRRELAHPMSEFLGTIVMVVVVWFGGTLILGKNSELSGPEFIAYLGIFYQIINPAKAFTTALYSIQKGLAAMDRIDMILKAEITISELPNARQIETLQSEIEYRNITFAYEEKLVLKNVSLSIPKGKTVALVGQSGSGKTTFVDLLPRFYDVTEGGIFIDGTDIRQLKLHDLRDLMGNVNQEAILFNDSIYNNIAFGVENTTKKEVIAAAKVANAHDFIIETENGYDTMIGDRGSKLSGGQRQRLSIARAILKNPPILILDEATSALDTESERLVQDALENLMKNRTSLVIAHRLSTVRNADLICVFHEGKIVEQGTHDELIERNGRYKRLHEMQMF
ncbi:MAG: antibiotic ABC transporter ATP-binding protein [Bacteroidetes bacterium GWF2_42_66]|nr:MAG: antibiotic ABC transporter ATP-binding protein [Bacteroidetes bacterium GWA2_42_15]OFY01016.1 MAG: antibiotic ABC transporter ATP-binding protein [Bacteroidetes bacterium GWE2_42_39]OFY41857.1 MAG: antibiotic ABC transporter ATP-binding protein [Bacteroidetes bacterium GWF2_42_66]HBL77967.1 antibiotic ABC transporter ATP-binding protein [Prolixibacteraceae bacterium]HCU63448.1 antibiotic ABC transporter ATP-binding protein [Prolixibacteraceae bacterium]